MFIKLSDTQLVMLIAAAQRDDRCLTLPERLKGAAAHEVATKLIAAGLVGEVKAKAGMPRYRTRLIVQSKSSRLTIRKAHSHHGSCSSNR